MAVGRGPILPAFLPLLLVCQHDGPWLRAHPTPCRSAPSSCAAPKHCSATKSHSPGHNPTSTTFMEGPPAAAYSRQAPHSSCCFPSYTWEQLPRYFHIAGEAAVTVSVTSGILSGLPSREVRSQDLSPDLFRVLVVPLLA